MKVEELKDVLALVLECVDCSVLIANEGGLTLADVSSIWSIIERVGPAFVGIENVPDELADLDEEDCDELIQFVMGELNVQDDKARIVVEKSMRAMKACYEVYLAVKA